MHKIVLSEKREARETNEVSSTITSKFLGCGSGNEPLMESSNLRKQKWQRSKFKEVKVAGIFGEKTQDEDYTERILEM